MQYMYKASQYNTKAFMNILTMEIKDSYNDKL